MKRISMRRLQAILLLTVVVLHSTGALAGTTTGSLTVTATVSSACSLSSGGGTLSFGTYDSINTNASSPLLQVSSFQLQCTNGTNATITLGQGQNPSAGSQDSAPLRNMTDGQQHYLNYQLYTTAARKAVWDNQTGVTQLATGTMQTLYVYGSIPGGQNLPAGTYTDTVVITVSY